MPSTATQFLSALQLHQSDIERKKYDRYFKMGEGDYGEGDVFIGVSMGTVFKLAKEFMDMDLAEIEKLLESPVHEARAGAVSIMDFQARDKKVAALRKKELYELYLRRHDRIDSWDLVDRSAQYVIGSYLADKPRDVLYRLARSASMWERRTAIVSTSYFIRMGQTDDTFAIAGILSQDPEDLVQKAYGGWIRHAGIQHPQKLLNFLDLHAATMPRTALRYALEHLSKEDKAYYMGMKK